MTKPPLLFALPILVQNNYFTTFRVPIGIVSIFIFDKIDWSFNENKIMESNTNQNIELIFLDKILTNQKEK